MSNIYVNAISNREFLGRYLDVTKPIRVLGVGVTKYGQSMVLIGLEEPYDISLSFDELVEVRLLDNKPMSHYLTHPHHYILVYSNYFEFLKEETR